ncbi:MAG: hypothetical protein EBU27_10515, partial [Opitutae bacterium]|nr:hypothetical protein [Opitutae bacterium]
MLHEASFSTQTLSIKLADGDSYVAERIQSQIIDDVSFTWSGRLKGGASGYLTFAKVQDVVRGTLTIFGGKAYNFKGTAKDLTFEEVVKIAECGGCSVHQESVIPRDPRMGAQPASTLTYPSLDFAEHAFNVNVISQIGAPSYTLAHEIGHNLGCLHNREDVNSSRDYSNYDFAAFCYGKRWETGGNAYRTVMSYNATPPNYQKVPYFSNPSVFYEGVATGNAGSENNAKVLQISSAYAANFRQSVVQSILPSQFSISVDEGNFTSFGVRLGVKPVSAVTVALNLSGDSDLMLGSQSTLSFDSSNWSLYQTVTVVGANDVDEVNGSAS